MNYVMLLMATTFLQPVDEFDHWAANVRLQQCYELKVTGTVTKTSETGVTEQRPWTFNQGSAQCDEMHVWNDPLNQIIRQSSFHKGEIKTFAESTPKSLVNWNAGSNVLSIMNHDDPQINSFINILNPESITFWDPSNFNDEPASTAKVLNYIRSQNPTFKKIPSGMIEVSSTIPLEETSGRRNYRETIVMDPQKGYSIVSKTLGFVREDDSLEVAENYKCNYVLMNQHWLPSKITSLRQNEELVLNLVWKFTDSCPVFDDRFMETALPDNALLTDSRQNSAAPIVFGTVGDFRKTARSLEQKAVSTSFTIRQLIWLNVIAVTVVGLLLVIFKRKKIFSQAGQN